MTTNSYGSVYLVPNILGGDSISSVLPSDLSNIVSRLKFFLAEDEKNARWLIKQLAPAVTLRELSIERLNEHTRAEEIEGLMSPLLNGNDLGIISEAGCPAVADPGSVVVKRAHQLGIRVRPLVGPCSMLLALMGSGFNGQQWRFTGYLPIEPGPRRDAIVGLESEVENFNTTQVVMDTPYRNQRLFDDLLRCCKNETRLCVAIGLTTSEEKIMVKTVAEWRKAQLQLGKIPSVFLLGR